MQGGFLQVAALQIRMVMEALTYERATRYAEELGPVVMNTWISRRLTGRILEIDPYADTTKTHRVGIEPSYGEGPDCMTDLGTDHAMSMATLHQHYDALGSSLHPPTIDQLERGKHTDGHHRHRGARCNSRSRGRIRQAN